MGEEKIPLFKNTRFNPGLQNSLENPMALPKGPLSNSHHHTSCPLGTREILPMSSQWHRVPEDKEKK